MWDVPLYLGKSTAKELSSSRPVGLCSFSNLSIFQWSMSSVSQGFSFSCCSRFHCVCRLLIDECGNSSRQAEIPSVWACAQAQLPRLLLAPSIALAYATLQALLQG